MREFKFRIWDKQYCQWLENNSSLHCYSNWTICPFTGKLVDYVGSIDGDHGDTFTASPAADYILQGKFLQKPRYLIQQYTGLNDKNGNEIYEGDIVNAIINDVVVPTNDERCVTGFIYWDDFYASWHFETSKEKHHLEGERYPFGSDDNCWVEAENMEVVGNIFETPELLKNE